MPPSPRASSGGGGGLSDGALWGIIAAAAALLLLLCCCCVCVFRRRKKKEEEEEEEEEIKGKGLPGDIEEQKPEQSAANVPPEADVPVVAVPVGAAPGEDDESEDEEDARKRRGGGPLGEEEEEEANKRWGGPRYPPPEKEDPTLKLKPVEKEEEEDPDWDQPGRPMDYPKDKDEMSAGEVEHYEPDGGVYLPERPGKNPVEYDPQWERGTPEEPDDRDDRKHRIQSGLGEGAVWNQLDENDSDDEKPGVASTNVFDWVVQSALGVLDNNDQAAHANVEGADPETGESS